MSITASEAEVGDSSEQSDGLDIADSTRRRLSKPINALPETDSDNDSNGSLERELLSTRIAPSKIEWSADEDEHPRERLERSRKRQRRSRKGKSRKQARSGHAADAGQSDDTKSEDEEEAEDVLPDYLQKRMMNFEKATKLSNAALRLPPSYDDIEFSDDEHIEHLQERPNFHGLVEASRSYKDIPLPHSQGLVPAPIAQYLRDYQIEGVAFLHHLFVFQKGGILGDDMGLGKTVQVAAFLAAAFGKTGDERDAKRMRKMRRAEGNRWYPKVLVVCPGSLIENWKNELNRWGYWHVDAFHGVDKDSVHQAALAGRLEVVITTYTTYRNCKANINLVEWDCVIADECHQIKDPRTTTTKDMNEVNALCRIGLTGTAIQNKYEELWTLLNWTNPGKLGPLAVWRSVICTPLQIGQSHNATMQQLSKARKTAKRLANNLLPRFFLRRTKALIAHQLPKKTDRVVFCPLTELQTEAYRTFLSSNLVKAIRDSSKECACGSGKKQGWCCRKQPEGFEDKWQAFVFPAIAFLQKISNHLALLLPRSEDSTEKQERDLQYLKNTLPSRWAQLYENRGSIVNLSNPEFCGKWKVLKKLLRYWHENGDKVLVFSHSVRLLHLLRHLFDNTSYNFSYLDGSMSYEDRAHAVDEFNSDETQFVFLISTKAGGVGLNITSANKVVIMDPNWNPSWDLQAQDRAYRIGQIRDVEVFRLVSAGTVEEIVYARQIYKQQQANIGYNASMERRYFQGVQNNPHHKGEIFGLNNLLSFHGDIFLRDIVNKANIAEAKAGVKLVDVDFDDDDDNPFKAEGGEDSAMSQLAAMLTEDDSRKAKISKKAPPNANAIQAILASASVEYTHENSEIIGTSKVEARLSRRAEATGNDAEFGEEVLFRDDEGQYEYHPPEDVMMRQFCTMAKTFGFESATEFGLIVEGWTQEQRRNCLEKFYRLRQELVGHRTSNEHARANNDQSAESQARGNVDLEQTTVDFDESTESEEDWEL